MLFSLAHLHVFRSVYLASRNMAHKVFVYGTLKRNEPNHYWLTDTINGVSKFVGEATTKTKYPLVIATRYNIPFLLYSPGKGSIIEGEVYEVDEAMLTNLDILEDHPNYYIREIDDINVKDSSSNEVKTLQCWVYFLKTFKPELLSRPHFSNYSSKGAHGLPYTERSLRDPSYNYKDEL